jgi:hypothetical protein
LRGELFFLVQTLRSRRCLQRPRAMMEMRYLWREPVGLDNRRLLATLGAVPH